MWACKNFYIAVKQRKVNINKSKGNLFQRPNRKNLTRFLLKIFWRKGDVLSSLLLNFAAEYTIRKAETKQEGLKVNIIHQILVYGDGVKTLDGRTHTVQKKHRKW